MRFFEVLVPKASAILFPVLRLVGDSGRYNTVLKVSQCPRLLETQSNDPIQTPAPFPSHSQVARSLSCYKPRTSMTKKGPFFGPHNVGKSRRAKRGLPSIVLDRPLKEAQRLVENPERFFNEILEALETHRNHPVLMQLLHDIASASASSTASQTAGASNSPSAIPIDNNIHTTTPQHPQQFQSPWGTHGWLALQSLIISIFFFCSNALIALARSLCKCLLAQLITASGANAVKGYLVRCACIDGTIP